MMRHRLLGVALSLGLVGCTVRPGSLVSLPSTAGAPVAASGQTDPAAGQAQEPVSEYGTLSLTIRWPERPSGYQTALIPTSTNTLVIKVASGSTVIGTTTIQRDSSATTATANLPVKAGNNLNVEVLAYREPAPLPQDATQIARGTANVNIERSRKTQGNVSLVPVNVPTITGLSVNAGVPGDTVTITGTNFGTGIVPVVVYFNGYITGASRASETSLTVKVPPGTPTGKVVVKADGVSSVSNMVFWVPKTLSVNPTKAFWDHSPATASIVMLGKTNQLFASTNWETKLGDTLGYYGTPPTPTWSSSNAAAGTVDANGLFTAGNAYVAQGTNVTASFGSMKSDPVQMIPESVNLSVQPLQVTPTLGGKGSAFVQFDAFNTFSDGATNSFVLFSADASASVDVTGLATATDFGSNGTIKVTAESQVDSLVRLSSNVTLTNYQVSTFAGDSGLGSTDGTAGSAKFRHPQGMAFDQAGNMYVADHDNGAIRRISGGVVSTVAITGLPAGIRPWGLAYYRDTANNMDWLYATDDSTHRVYRIELVAGGTSGNGIVLAGSGGSGYVDGAGAAASFNSPKGIVVDANRNLFVADDLNACIRKVDAAGMVTTYVGSPFGDYVTPFNRDGWGTNPTTGPKFVHPTGLAYDSSGIMYVTQVNDGRIRCVSTTGDVTTRTLSESLLNPMGIAVDPQGALFVTDESRGRVYKVSPQGKVMAIVGSGNAGIPSLKNGIGSSADLRSPNGIVLDGNGNLYVSEYTNNVIRKLE